MQNHTWLFQGHSMEPNPFTAAPRRAERTARGGHPGNLKAVVEDKVFNVFSPHHCGDAHVGEGLTSICSFICVG